MLSILSGCILCFTSLSKSLNGKRLLQLENDNEYELEKSNDDTTRRELVAVSTVIGILSLIAGTTTAGINTGKAIAGSITDDGAIFTINNYFAKVDIHHAGTHIAEGSTLVAPKALIHAASVENTGGAFDDSGPGDSAGYVQYQVNDPENPSISYCIGYAWSSEANSLCWTSNSHDNWVVYSLTSKRCLTDLNAAANAHYNLIRISCGKGTYTVNHIVADGTYNVQQVGTARNQERRILSQDGKIGITAAISTPDGDRDHPQIRIDIGPRKKIFG